MSKRKRTKRDENENSEEGEPTDNFPSESDDVVKNREGISLQNWDNSQEKTSEALATFLKQGWKIVTELGEVAREEGEGESEIRRKEISRKNAFSTSFMIDKMFPKEAVCIIMEGWNDALQDAVKNGNGTRLGRKVEGTGIYSKRILKSEEEVYHFL